MDYQIMVNQVPERGLRYKYNKEYLRSTQYIKDMHLKGRTIWEQVYYELRKFMEDLERSNEHIPEDHKCLEDINNNLYQLQNIGEQFMRKCNQLQTNIAHAQNSIRSISPLKKPQFFYEFTENTQLLVRTKSIHKKTKSNITDNRSPEKSRERKEILCSKRICNEPGTLRNGNLEPCKIIEEDNLIIKPIPISQHLPYARNAEELKSTQCICQQDPQWKEMLFKMVASQECRMIHLTSKESEWGINCPKCDGIIQFKSINNLTPPEKEKLLQLNQICKSIHLPCNICRQYPDSRDTLLFSHSPKNLSFCNICLPCMKINLRRMVNDYLQLKYSKSYLGIDMDNIFKCPSCEISMNIMTLPKGLSNILATEIQNYILILHKKAWKYPHKGYKKFEICTNCGRVSVILDEKPRNIKFQHIEKKLDCMCSVCAICLKKEGELKLKIEHKLHCNKSRKMLEDINTLEEKQKVRCTEFFNY